MGFKSIDLFSTCVLLLPSQHQIPWEQEQGISSMLITALVKDM